MKYSIQFMNIFVFKNKINDLHLISEAGNKKFIKEILYELLEEDNDNDNEEEKNFNSKKENSIDEILNFHYIMIIDYSII